MPFLGAHLSIAGGFHKAVAASKKLGCTTVQIFTKSPNAWDAKPIAPADAAEFRRAVAEAGLHFPTAHDSYLINLAAPDEKMFQKSITAFVTEIQRAEMLGLSYLVSHPGAHNDSGEDAGLTRLISGLDIVRERCPDVTVKVLLETTAGQGSCLGARFEHLSRVLTGVQDRSWLGVCLDTCHIFAAGYPITAPEDYANTFNEFDRIVGFENLKLIHVNDSVPGLGSRVDRHANLGQGQIGLEFFERFVTDPRFSELPMILETPKEDDDGQEMDPVNLAILRRFLGE
jgi:deoxyribonuclease-4